MFSYPILKADRVKVPDGETFYEGPGSTWATLFADIVVGEAGDMFLNIPETFPIKVGDYVLIPNSNTRATGG